MPPLSHGPSIRHSLSVPQQLCSREVPFLYQQASPGSEETWGRGCRQNLHAGPSLGIPLLLEPWYLPFLWLPKTLLACLDKVLSCLLSHLNVPAREIKLTNVLFR